MMGMCLAEHPPRNRQTRMIRLKKNPNPLNLLLIRLFLRNLLCQIGQTNQIFCRSIGQKRKGARCKFLYGISLRSLVEIHPAPHQNRFQRKTLQTNQVSTTRLKWLEPVPSTFYVLIRTDNTRNPFLQALIRSSNSVSNRDVERSISFKTSARISRNPD